MKEKNLGIDIILHSRIKSLSIRLGLPLCEIVKLGIDMLDRVVPETDHVTIQSQILSKVTEHSNETTDAIETQKISLAMKKASGSSMAIKEHEVAGCSYNKTGWHVKPIEVKQYSVMREDQK